MKRLGWVLIVLFSGVLLACQLQYVLPTPEPSAAPRATRTRTPGSGGSTAVPTFPAQQVLPTLPQGGPVSAPVMATAKENLRVRAGPSASTQQVGSLTKGDTAQVVGRTAANDWWQILLPSNLSVRGWVLASFTDVSGSIGSIPVTTSSSVPAPQPYPAQPPAPAPQPYPAQPPASVKPTPTQEL
jgi:hypothetical protein